MNSLSLTSLLAPYKLDGPDALSVDRATTFSTPQSMQASITFIAPIMLVLIHSKGSYSAIGTIFVAAACTTKSTPLSPRYRRSLSLTSPIKNLTLSSSLYFLAISHCFISSRENIIIFFGLYFSRVKGTKD